MKKSVLCAVLCAVAFLTAAGNIYAEESEQSDEVLHNEIYAGWGTQSLASGFRTTISSIFSSIGSEGDNNWTNNPTGVFQLGYNFALTKNWLFGAFGTYEYTYSSKDNSPAVEELFAESAQAKATFMWGWKHIKIYHAVSAGCAWYQSYSKGNGGSEDSGNESAFAFNITPVGVRYVPAEHFYIFAECSFPTTGFINAGIGAKF